MCQMYGGWLSDLNTLPVQSCLLGVLAYRQKRRLDTWHSGPMLVLKNEAERLSEKWRVCKNL